MKNILFAFTLFCLPFVMVGTTQTAVAQEDDHPAADAHADVTKEFEVRSSQDKTIQWAEKNRKIIQDTLHITVLEDMGKGKFKVKREYQGEEFVWIMQEVIGTTSKGQYVYKSKMTDPVDGGVVYAETYIVLTKAGHGTHVSLRMFAGINNPVVKSKLMQIDFVNRLNKCRKLFESNLD